MATEITFNEQQFEKRLLTLKDTQESISTLSSWCLQQHQHHKKIVSLWLQVLKKGMLIILLNKQMCIKKI